MNKELKRYLISTVVTFLATFLTVVGASIGSLTDANVTSAAVAGIVIAAGRFGVKAALEYLIPALIIMLKKLKSNINL